jgi:ABC-2 type transport system ATP-binding protein
MAQTADRLVVVGRGRLLADTTVDALVEQSEDKGVRVATGEPARLRSVLAAPGVTITSAGAERLVVSGMDTRRIGQLAAEHQVPLYELVAESVSLEEAFMNLTQDAVEYHSSDAGRAA